VVRYDLGIVLAYTGLAVLLAVSLARGRAPGHWNSWTAATVLTLAALLIVRVAGFTYLPSAPATAVRYGVAGAALVSAVCFLAHRRHGSDVGLGVAVGAYLISAAFLIRLDPAPRIDVWTSLQQGSDAMLRGENIYRQVWVGSPGIKDAFTYLPGTAVLLGPGRWLAGDVRWALVVATLVAALLIRRLGGHLPSGRTAGPAATTAAGCAALLLLLPGTSTQVEQAWTEPLLLALLAGWALAVQKGRPWIAVALMALGLASKQHLWLLLPVVAAWREFGVRRAGIAAAGSLVAVLPWVIASPSDLWHDTVWVLISFPPIRFADTLYLAARHELGWTPPFWLTGAVVLGTLAVTVRAVHRRQPDLGEVLRWCALVMLVANLVNKQAFYNQYWLVAALVLLSWAVPPARPAALPRSGAQAELSSPAPPPAGAEV
jgi:hypothetical protein